MPHLVGAAMTTSDPGGHLRASKLRQLYHLQQYAWNTLPLDKKIKYTKFALKSDVEGTNLMKSMLIATSTNDVKPGRKMTPIPGDPVFILPHKVLDLIAAKIKSQMVIQYGIVKRWTDDNQAASETALKFKNLVLMSQYFLKKIFQLRRPQRSMERKDGRIFGDGLAGEERSAKQPLAYALQAWKRGARREKGKRLFVEKISPPPGTGARRLPHQAANLIADYLASGPAPRTGQVPFIPPRVRR